MHRAVVILGHTDPRSFNSSLARAYAEGLEAAGVEVEVVELGSLEFDPVLRVGHAGTQPLEPDLRGLGAAIEGASHLVLAFPTYWVCPPALVRGLVDRLFSPGWAFRYSEGRAFPEGLLRGRSARVIVTMDAPGWYYRLVYRRAIEASMGRGTLRFCGFDPVRFSRVHGVRELEAPARDAWRRRLHQLGLAEGRELSRRSLGSGVRSPLAGIPASVASTPE